VDFEILATYYGVNGTLYFEKRIGELRIAHVTPSSSLYVGYKIPPNASYPNPDGSGTVYWLNGATVGTIYNMADSGSPKCSDGPHTHLEFYSSHAWGLTYEWHSSGGPDSYHGLWFNPDHIHSSSYGGGSDSVSQGQILGFVGGGSTLPWMYDNPNHSGH
jgi:hypothetical protein